jgi:predicted TIM-barrel fold metal-dependent hydrolase
MTPLTIVSADAHIGAPVEKYREYLEPKYRHLMPELLEEETHFLELHEAFDLNNPQRLARMDDRKRIQSGGIESSWETERRLQELDAEGIAAEVLYPGANNAMTPFFYPFNKPYPDDVRWAGTKAHHRWLAEVIAPAKGRLIGCAEPGPSLNMDETIDELRFVAERGFRAVFVPGFIRIPALPPLFDRHFEPFWAACNDLGLVLTIHAGWNGKPGGVGRVIEEFVKLRRAKKDAGGGEVGHMDGFMEVINMVNEDNPDSVFALDLEPRQAIWQLVFSGVFDRYPNLKLVVAECRGDWVPEWKAHVDERFLTAGKRPKLKMKPSEYFGRNVLISPSSPRRAEVEMRHAIGVQGFLFGTDFPHPEGTWPNTLAWMRAVFYDVPESELRAILGENAIHAYGLDKQLLDDVAAKIGPLPSDIIGDYKVDERLIADFDFRSHFNKPTSKRFERTLLDKIVDRDLLATAV